MKKLSGKQKLFVEYYIQTWNATDAARKAGYSGGYATLRVTGSRNLTKDNIRAEINNRLEETIMQSNEVLNRLGDMAKGFDVSDYTELRDTYAINKDGKEYLSGVALWLDLVAMKRDGFSHLIKKIKSTGKGIEIEWHDQMAALVHIGKHYQLFTDNVDITTKGEKLDIGLWLSQRENRKKQVDKLE